MDCQIHRALDVAELVLIGSLDSSWSSYLSDRIDEVIRGGALEVRIDMAGISYLSSNGIALLVRYHQQLRKIGGRIRIVADSESVSHVLRLTGVAQILRDDGASLAPTADPATQCEVIEREGMSLQFFPNAYGDRIEHLELIGDPGRLPDRGYEALDERTWMAVPGSAAFGLGALGPSFEACSGRFGEFLVVAGVAAYRPSAGPGRPDFEHAVGAFVPAVRVLYGLVFPTVRAAVARFEAKGEPDSASVALSQIASACLDQAGGGIVGIVLAGESDGLVGAALQRSPVNLPPGLDPFAHPHVRDWLSLTPEPEHSRSTALVVGVATREPGPALAPFVRPLSGESAAAGRLQGHFHAAVVPYRPLAGGAIALSSTVKHLFEPGRIETILHLLCDSRPILGAGESTFTRGVIWYVPLAVGGESGLP
jgi:anti-anti-sigma factor